MTRAILQRVRTGHGGEPVAAAGAGRSAVDVSVIVPLHDCRPYLDRCLTSLLVQRVDKEIVVVDDGSTDGGGELADLYAACHPGIVRVVHQEGSGGAGRPRNTGLSVARGRYVFFCDADDYLGPEALERMLAMAERNGSDIVLGKIVGHGRRAPVSMFQENAERVPLEDSAVYNSLSCFKLFRREMIERHGVRFDEKLTVGEDIVFTAHAYCHAEVISVVADYDCYHLVDRPDGTSIMQRKGSRDPISWMRMIRRPIELVAAHVQPGPLRDHLLRRHLRLDALAHLGRSFLEAGEIERKEIAAEVADLCERWLTDGVRERLPPVDRHRIAALEDIDRLVRLAHIESAAVRRELTGLRWDAGATALTVSGRVALDALGTAGRPELAVDGVTLVLRPRPDGEPPRADVVVPTAGDGGEITGTIDLTGLSSGVWDVHVAVECEGIVRTARLGADRDGTIARPEPRVVGGTIVLPYFTRPHGNLSIDVGGHVLTVPGTARLTRSHWAAGHRLALTGEVTVGRHRPVPAGPRAVRRLVWRDRHSGRELYTPVTAGPDGGFTARTAAGRAAAGTWDAYLELDLGGPPVRFRVEAAAELIAPARTWWRGTVRRTAKPYGTAGKGRLSMVVRAVPLRTLVRRMLR
ncbi:glycosyltransferase family 2 protein [Planomonospora sp. ID91781]|uniref:glycosyltransferase family 2 protein n=1 Tax=Planomonospora sp. ID91781 TaxID=2738135 RepID=UPI0018C442D1|nr:glycosyltransferase family 2 protein [Planomonospora sp. ID91781]MBG0820604.1 glycosyltransferase family 2 protein [Planomonospora sp. ID91781]